MEAALREWLLDRIESLPVWKEPELQTVARLADHLARDPEVVEAARLYTGRRDVDASALVDALVKDEAVPYFAALRFKPSGRRKRQAWEETWDRQRREDEIDVRAALAEEDPRHLPANEVAHAKEAAGVDDIPVPPRYTAGDFARSSWWRLRGKLDVPKERFISYPATRIGADDSPVLGWAGWDHLQRARALAGHYQRRKDEGGGKDELVPLLAGLQELVPWLLQWHNEPDSEFGQRMGEFFETFVESEGRAMNLTAHDLRTWTP